MVRSRLDWNLDMAMGAADTETSGSSAFPQVSLYNNSVNSDRLAVMAVLAWSSNPIPIVTAYLAGGNNGASTVSPSPVWNKGTQIGGAIYHASTFSTPDQPTLFSFVADGKTWLRNGDTPLAVLDPAWRFEIYAGPAPNQVIQRPSTLTVSFIWTIT
jgi:hypothetical protein